MANGSSAAGNVDLNTISTVVAGVLTSLQSTSRANPVTTTREASSPQSRR